MELWNQHAPKLGLRPVRRFRDKAVARGQEILDDIDGIAFCHLGGRDVVRHKIVQDIVEAYDRFGQQRLEVQP